ncbi:MAG: nitrate/nitrite transporter [Lysobacterales bacterium]
MGSGIKSPGIIIAAMFVANVSGMTSMVSFPTLVAVFQSAWDLNNTEAGWISGVYFAGYVVAVPVLTGLTDRIDPRKIIIASMILGVIATGAFALWASGFWTATFWRFLQGASFAGTYMPTIKALSDTLPESKRNRGAAFLTSSYACGASLSFFLTGQLGTFFGWQTAFLLLAVGPFLGLCLTATILPPNPPLRQDAATFALDYRAVFRNKRALAYMIAYGVHNGEGSIMRSWVVSYMIFAQAGVAAGDLIVGWSPAVIATVASLLGVPATVLIAELVPKVGRRQVISLVMMTSAMMGIGLAVSLWGPYGLSLALVLLYGAAIAADSGTINGGIIARAKPDIRGQTMAMHALFAAAAAFVLPILFGMVLDLAGGEQSEAAWAWAFSATAVFVVVGPIALFTLDRPEK